MAAVKKFVCVCMAIVFVVCVYSYGTTKRFSFEAYVNNISGSIGDIPSLQGIVDIWTDAPDRPLTGGGDGWRGDSEGNRPDTEEQGFWDRCYAFFNNIGEFFVNLWESILYILDMLVAVFDVLAALLPWNGTVDISSNDRFVAAGV